ncbi:Spore coat protein U (SCPU) domain-containing protein [Rhizobiales bacterium GAS191]|nr:Spore coat protein U (SCPU) domain-containing protein [Rhizobiales bacterium GAS191]
MQGAKDRVSFPFRRRNSACRSLVKALCCLVSLLVCDVGASAQTCTVSMPAVAFGSVNVLTGTAVDTTSTMTVSCTGGGAFGIRLCISLGVGSAGDTSSRQLTGPSSAKLRYDLYSDSARTLLWGSWQTGYDTSGVQLDVPANGSTPVTVNAGLLGSQQTAAAGSYSSTFTANPFIQYANRFIAACPTGGKTTSTSTSATATVLSSCNVSATTLNFGTASVLTHNVDATSSLSVQCSNSLPYTVALNGGNSGATDPTQRKMANGAAQITYGLYRDPARTLPWGSTTGSNTAAGTGTGAAQALTVYGRVSAQTTPAPATYQDTIVVTITY